MERRGVDEMKSLNRMIKREALLEPSEAGGWRGQLRTLLMVLLIFASAGGVFWFMMRLDPSGSAVSAVGLLAACAAGLFLYFLPTMVAAKRGHRNREGVFLLNLLLGWTLLGWAVALVWAVYRERD